MRLLLNRNTHEVVINPRKFNNGTSLPSTPPLTVRTAQIKEFSGYLIRSDGKVFRDGAEVKPFIRGKHLFVAFYHVGPLGSTARYDVKLSRVVARYFLPAAPYPAAVVLHRDKNRENCSVDNLYWGSLEEAKTLYKQPKPRGRMGRKPKDFTDVYKAIIGHLYANPEQQDSIDHIAEATGLGEQTVRKRLVELVRMEKVTVELGKKYSMRSANGRPAYLYGVPQGAARYMLEDFTNEDEFMAQMAAIEEEDRRIDALQKD